MKPETLGMSIKLRIETRKAGAEVISLHGTAAVLALKY